MSGDPSAPGLGGPAVHWTISKPMAHVYAKHVGIEGLSRYGKRAALHHGRLTSVFAEEASSAPPAKAAPRSIAATWGELVENIAGTGEYHWMAGNFLKYAGPLDSERPARGRARTGRSLRPPSRLHQRWCTQQGEGGWVDAKGMFLAAVGAGPVYKLLGKKDLGASEFPAIETALIEGDIAFRQHSGGHTTGPNWPTFLIFASRYFPPLPATSPTPQIGRRATGNTCSAIRCPPEDCVRSRSKDFSRELSSISVF